VTSTAAFLYTSADCVINYVTQNQRHHHHHHHHHHQQQQEHDYHGGNEFSLPAFTICNLNPLRSPLDALPFVSSVVVNVFLNLFLQRFCFDKRWVEWR